MRKDFNKNNRRIDQEIKNVVIDGSIFNSLITDMLFQDIVRSDDYTNGWRTNEAAKYIEDHYSISFEAAKVLLETEYSID